MFWNFFSSAFGLVFGVLVAIVAFAFLCLLIGSFGDWLRDKYEKKQKKNCVRCIAKKKNPNNFSYVGTKLCDKCKKEEGEDDNEIGDGNVFRNSSVVQITNNGTTTTWVNGRKVK